MDSGRHRRNDRAPVNGRVQAAVCSFYARGCCKYGNSCRFLHPSDLQPPQDDHASTPRSHHSKSSEESNSTGVSPIHTSVMEEIQSELPQTHLPCIYFSRGFCQFGDRCRYAHTEVTSVQEVVDCPICLQAIQTPKLFGLLSSCDHAVCLDCIRSWRKSDAQNEGKYGCPICRTESRLVIPSSVFATGREKNEIRATYLTRLSSIPCKLFNYGQGHCRFAPECNYAHLTTAGELAIDSNGLQHPGKPKPRSTPSRRSRLHTDPNANPLTEWEMRELLRISLENDVPLNPTTLSLFRLWIRMGLPLEDFAESMLGSDGEVEYFSDSLNSQDSYYDTSDSSEDSDEIVANINELFLNFPSLR